VDDGEGSSSDDMSSTSPRRKGVFALALNPLTSRLRVAFSLKCRVPLGSSSERTITSS
jgi:hypothetical protein